MKKCAPHTSWAEDFYFMLCLKGFGHGSPTRTYDARGREHFFIATVTDSVIGGIGDNSSWMWENFPPSVGRGLGYASSRPVTYHYIKLDRGMAYYYQYLEWTFLNVCVDPLV